jgi:serine protease Do
MSIYSLPKFQIPKAFSFCKNRSKFLKQLKKKTGTKNRKAYYALLVVLTSAFFGMAGGLLTSCYYSGQIDKYIQEMKLKIPEIPEKEKIIEKEYVPQTTWEEKIIKAVSEASPSVVSIIVSKNLPIYEEYYEKPFEEFEDFFGEEFFQFQIPQYRQKGTEKKEVGGGTGFIISKDGLVLTNKHVVADKEAEYTILTNAGEKLPAEVLALDPFKDLAVIKIKSQEEFEPLKLGDSDSIKTGQTVIAIGNALGEFQNTISVGVISGLKREVIATGGGESELLKNLIQTDAAINRGNSGGPLLDLKGEVVGINVAMSEVAENIGFAISINEAKKAIEQVKKIGKIVYPFLGIYYIMITPEIQEEHGLPVGYGAWIGKSQEGKETEIAVVPDSPAEKANLERGDIILEFDGRKLTRDNSLADIILDYSPEDRITIKVLKAKSGEIKTLPVVLTGTSG